MSGFYIIQTQYQYLINCYARLFRGDNKIKTRYLPLSNITYSHIYGETILCFQIEIKNIDKATIFITVLRSIDLITFFTRIFSRSLH